MTTDAAGPAAQPGDGAGPATPRAATKAGRLKLAVGVGGWLCALVAVVALVASAKSPASVTATSPYVLDLTAQPATDRWNATSDQADLAEDWDIIDNGDDLAATGDDPFATDGFTDPFGDGSGDLDPFAGDAGWDDSGWDDSGWEDDGYLVNTWEPDPPTTTTTVPPTTTTAAPTTTSTVPPTTTTVPTTTTTAPPVPQGGWCDRTTVPRAATGAVAIVRAGTCLRAEEIVPAPGQSLDDAVAAARARADVVSAGPVSRVRVQGADPLRSEQWALDAMHTGSFQASPNTARIVVAVLDTGVQATHAELRGAVQVGYDAIAVGDGRTDPNGHGTLIAGIISAATGNDVGIAGFGGRPRILPVRVVDAAGYGTSLDVAAGIDWAVAHGAHVINLSLGTTTADEHLRLAVQRAITAGAVVVASAGNDGAVGNAVSYPAAFPGVIGVGSIDRTLQHSAFSTAGIGVTVVAPGQDIVSTWWDGGYARASGTSLAAAHASAAVAVLLGDGASPATMRTLLAATATDLGPAGVDPATGAGLIDVVAARLRIPTSSTLSTTTTVAPTTTTTTVASPATTTTLAGAFAATTTRSSTTTIAGR